MLRTLLFPVLLLVSVLTVSILLLRLRPYDARPVQAVMALMDDCTRPCFLGIRPGSTTDEAAQALLAAHPWVSNLVVYRDTGGQVRNMIWDWNAQAPPLLDTSGVVEVVDQRVQRITLRTRIRTGDIRLVYGPPTTTHAEALFYEAVYPAQGFSALSSVTCGTFWQGWVTLIIETGPPGDFASAQDRIAARQEVCRSRR